MNVGNLVCGTVVHVLRSGVLISVPGHDLPGNLEVIEMENEPKLRYNNRSLPQVGTEICAVVIQAEAEAQIRLSAKRSCFEKFGHEFDETGSLG